MYDLAIIGAGPAGMTAAVYAARKRIGVLLIGRDMGGQAVWASKVENYMGYEYIEGAELMRKFEEQVRLFPIEQRIGEAVDSIRKVDRAFELRLSSGEIEQARAVILATGKQPRALGVPGEDALKGRGVSYCTVCDGPLFAGRDVAVVGGGYGALEAARDMAAIAGQVYLISPAGITGDPEAFEKLKARPNFHHYSGATVLEIVGRDTVESVKIEDRPGGIARDLPVKGVFVEIGRIPSSQLARGLAGVNAAGEIEIGRGCETATPGLFAAGDVTDYPDKQIVMAAAEGAKAALQAHRYIQSAFPA